MCGINGIIKKSNVTKGDVELVKQMNKCIAHRGPDGEGIYWNDHIILGHRRLAILDLSQDGKQPMHYMNRYSIVLNGEIYNYIELKEQLMREGYCFYSKTDTEVVMAAYDFWGSDCFEKFNGMWALALFDNQSQDLILSRDRFGVKPLYYYRDEQHIVFASEIKSLLIDKSIKRVANDAVVYDYLIQGLVDHTNNTFFQNVYQFPPASYVCINNKLEWKEHVFWQLNFNNEIGAGVTEKMKLEFCSSFMESVKIRLRSDVPVGSCLSGGLDSSAIVCAINKISEQTGEKKKQYTFSYRANDKKLDEYKYMKSVVDYTRVEAKYISPTQFDFLKEMDDLIYHQDEPFSTTGMYAGYCVYREAGKNGVKVLLDGQGADEFLCGYRKSRIYYLKQLIDKKKVFVAMKELMLSLGQIKTSLLFKSNQKSDINKIIRILRPQKEIPNVKQEYLNSKFVKTNCGYGYDVNSNFQYNDVFKISLPSLLRYTDRNSMAFSVESRLPFLDYQFAEQCANLPLSAKLRNGYSKYIMRKALILPKKIRKRKDKLGFATPEDQWIRASNVELKKIFDNAEFKSLRYINREKVLENWNEIIFDNKIPYFFRLICLEKWMQIFDVE